MLQLLTDTGVSDLSTEIAGPLTLDAAQGPYKEELDKLIREAESVLSEARIYQVPYIANLQKSRKAQLLEEHQYYSRVRNVNFKIDSVSFFYFIDNISFCILTSLCCYCFRFLYS